MPTHLTVFFITVWLLAMLPGAGQALMVRQTLAGGRSMATACIIGVATGMVLWSVAAALGLSAVLLANPAAYLVVRICGGIVLVVLGASTLWALRKSVGTRPVATGEQRKGAWNGFLGGLATNLGNPKAGVFAISVLPQFVTTRGPVLLSTIVLGVIWALVTASWYVLFTWAVGRGRVLMSSPAMQRRLRVLTGSVLLALGVAVAVGV